jgi:hypothetical protein
MFIFIIPYYNGFNRLIFSLDSIRDLRLSTPYEIHVINNNSQDCDRHFLSSQYQKVFVHTFKNTLPMAENWNRAIQVVAEQTGCSGWYMLHVGDKVTVNFNKALETLYDNPTIDLIVGNSNLLKVDSSRSLLSRTNFPNITQIIFSNRAPLPNFEQFFYPVFDVVALSPILSSVNTSFVESELVFRSLDEHDATTSVVWFKAAFTSLIFVPILRINLTEKIILANHFFRLGAGDLLRTVKKLCTS